MSQPRSNDEEPEIVHLNLDDLDVQDLEKRLELASLAPGALLDRRQQQRDMNLEPRSAGRMPRRRRRLGVRLP